MTDNLERRNHIIIEGVNHDGDKFRPSDWVERLASILSHFGENQRLKYDKSVMPCTIQGIKSLVVNKQMEIDVPEAYEFIINFATQNNLRVQEDRRV